MRRRAFPYSAWLRFHGNFGRPQGIELGKSATLQFGYNVAHGPKSSSVDPVIGNLSNSGG